MSNIRRRIDEERGLQPEPEAENARVNKKQDGKNQRQCLALRGLADSCIDLDYTCLCSIKKLQNLGKQSFRQPFALLSHVVQRLDLLDIVMVGDLEFRVKYLTDPDDAMTIYLEAAEEFIINGLYKSAGSRKDRSTYKRGKDATIDMIRSIDDAASDTERYIVKALRLKQLNGATQEALRIRWSHLDSFWNLISDYDPRMTRKSSSWQTILDASGQRKNQTTGTIDILMWSTFLVTVGIAIPTTALGWQYSNHQPGTPKDADFWSLIQSCSMVLLSLLTMTLSMWKGTDLPDKTARTGLHLFMGAGAVSALIAPILYIFVPTEWSALLNIFAGAVQAFVMLRLALAAESMTTPSQKTKKE